jgi:leucyl aminopeptidase
LESAGIRADDRVWRLPIGEEYVDQLKSNFADIANVGGREGGASTAASFLSKFAKDLQWAHLDVAGTAWLSGAHKGSTGRPVPLLVDFLINRVRAT